MKKKSKCSTCNVEYELELIGFNFWERRTMPSVYECPNCSKKYYIREPQWLKSLKWDGVKISKRYNQEKIDTSRQAFCVDLNAKEVYKILKSKDVTHLHHANTVRTSKTFLGKKALLSREYIDRESLYQTGQDSDANDVKYGIHNFVFLDGKDLANYFSRPNHYGPVLFKMALDLLLSDEIPTVRISRRNPIYWRDEDALNDRYYNNLNEFEDKYLTGDKLGDGNTMFMITTTNGSLSLENYLQGISVDNPNLIFSNNSSLISKIADYFEPELKQLGKRLVILNRFTFQYNLMRLSNFEKYRKFFSTKKNND